MTTIEYKSVSFKDLRARHDTLDINKLNDLGKDGWELVSIFSGECVFKRQSPEKIELTDDQKRAEYNKAHVKAGDRIINLLDKKEYGVGVVDEIGIYTNTELYSYPNTPRLDFCDFKIVEPTESNDGVTIQSAAISSMNYFFLRTMTEKMDDEAVNEELSMFIEKLNSNVKALNEESVKSIQQEINDGEYFAGLSIAQTQEMLNQAILRLTGCEYTNVTAFYVSLAI